MHPLCRILPTIRLPAYPPVMRAPKKLTDQLAAKLPGPERGSSSTYIIHWCPATPGLGVRVAKKGTKTWIFERRRLDGRTIRRTLGYVVGSQTREQSITAYTARRRAAEVESQIQEGRDPLEEQQATAEDERLTFAVALDEYLLDQQRTIPLKARTIADYRRMIEPAVPETPTTRARAAGMLYTLAATPLSRIDGAAVRKLWATLKPGRQRVYAAQVLRAVANWHGHKIDAFGKEVAKRDRLVLPQTKARKNPIRAEHLGEWVLAARATEGGDYFLFQLLSGLRTVEISGDEYGNEPIRVRDVDLTAARIIVKNTKNRSDHELLLSKQALAIARHAMEGKRKDDPLFSNGSRRVLEAINTAAGLAPRAHSPHDLRSTFATIAHELVPILTTRRMLNHSSGGDVTAVHYVSPSDTALRAGWQAVADEIDRLAKSRVTHDATRS